MESFLFVKICNMKIKTLLTMFILKVKKEVEINEYQIYQNRQMEWKKLNLYLWCIMIHL